MKYLILVPDGAADIPVDSLNHKTPLEIANKPHIDWLAKNGRCGLMQTIPAGMPAGSEVANLSILGYAPEKCYQGRGVLEAASLGIRLNDNDVAFRCNTIFAENEVMVSHSAGYITSSESCELIDTLNKDISSEDVKFYAGLDYRHILVLKEKFSPAVYCFPPHDNIGKKLSDIMPYALSEEGEKTAGLLRDIIFFSGRIFGKHPVNLKRISENKHPANFIWPWSGGKKPVMETFTKKFGISGAIISAVDLIKGIGVYAGFDVIKVYGATGLYNTNYQAKASSAIEALTTHDLVYVHVEAADEASHEGDVELKIRCIEDFDKRLIAYILRKIDLNNTAIAVIPDHFTPVSLRGHTSQKVPFLIYHPHIKPDEVTVFSEKNCLQGGFGVIEGETFMRLLLQRI
ncbi:MAG TPA: cofactor-independent phosphoglycerate mutase [bacterium]|nr:cofactor-independent phosphoglycerate mutase [bacterium]